LALLSITRYDISFFLEMGGVKESRISIAI